MSIKGRLLAIIVVIIAVLAGAAWYLFAPKPPVEEVIVIGTTDKITVMDPAKAYDFYTWEVFNNILEGLVKYEPETLRIIPGLAESWEISPDGREYTFKLREGLKFSDGTPLTAEVVKWSIERVMRLGEDPAWLVTEFVDRVEVIDDFTVKFILKEPVSFFLALLALDPPYFPISPATWPADEVKDVDVPACIGPYRVVKWVRDVELVFEANPDYYGPAPKTKKIVVKFFKDAATMRMALERGEIDIAWRTLPPADIKDIKEEGKFNVIEVPGPYIRYLILRCDRPPFDDVRLRRAIAAAIDRKAIVDKVFLGTVEPLYSMIPKGMWSHIDAFKEEYGERNLELARELLRQAGYSEEKPFEIELWYTPTHYGDTEKDVAAVIKEALEETGMIKVTLKSAEWATYAGEYIKKGVMPIFLLGWYPDYIDPDDYTSPFVALEPGHYGLGTFYYNPEVLDLIREARVKLAIEERIPLYEEIQRLFAKEVPHIPLFQGKLVVVARPDVKGIVLDATMLFRYYLLYRA